MLRITNNMIAENNLWNINNNLRRLDKAQEKVSTQSKIQLPSEDPIIATRALKYRNYVASMEQYQRNVDDAVSWMEVSESALNQLGSVIQRVRELTVQASNTGTVTDDDKKKIRSEISMLKNNALEILNTSYAGRYVFGGFTTDQPPYKVETTEIGDKVIYKGQYVNLDGPVSCNVSDAKLIEYCKNHLNEIYKETGKQQIQYNTGFGSQIQVNVEGQEIVGKETGGNLFDVFDKLLLGLDGQKQYKDVKIDQSSITPQVKELKLNDLLLDLDKTFDRAVTVRADLGARMNYLKMAQGKNQSDYSTYVKLMSKNEDIDAVQASIDAKSAEYTYNASLSVGAKVITNSLIDYLK